MLSEHYRLFCTVLSQRFVKPEGEEEYESFNFMKKFKGHHDAVRALADMSEDEKKKVLQDMEMVHNAALGVVFSFPPRLIFTLRYFESFKK